MDNLSNRLEWDFPATLKTADGKVLEYGTACVDLAGGSIDFKSDFVPMFAMGTPLQIVRTQDAIPTQIFHGQVYLSSEKLLRLVSVSDEVLPHAALAYPYDVKLAGQAEALLPGRRRLFGKRQPQRRRFDVWVYALTPTQIKFTCEEALTQGQYLTLWVNGPLCLQQVALEVDLAITFWEGAASSYRCKVMTLGEENRRQLEEYLRRVSLAVNKAFPPVGKAGRPALIAEGLAQSTPAPTVTKGLHDAIEPSILQRFAEAAAAQRSAQAGSDTQVVDAAKADAAKPNEDRAKEADATEEADGN